MVLLLSPVSAPPSVGAPSRPPAASTDASEARPPPFDPLPLDPVPLSWVPLAAPLAAFAPAEPDPAPTPLAALLSEPVSSGEAPALWPEAPFACEPMLLPQPMPSATSRDVVDRRGERPTGGATFGGGGNLLNLAFFLLTKPHGWVLVLLGGAFYFGRALLF